MIPSRKKARFMPIVRVTSISIVLLFFVLLIGCQPSPTPREQLELARQNGDPFAPRIYFTYFLAIQDEFVYELAHPDTHERIQAWIEANESTCNENVLPDDYISSLTSTTLYCRCDVIVEGMSAVLDERSSYDIIADFDAIRYRDCARQ